MGVRSRLKLNAKRAIRHMSPRHIIRTRLSARTIRDYADKVGMVYFGAVSPSDDDHRLVRGHTVSTTHMDNHYCVGTIRGYDTAVVLRNDVIKLPKGGEQRCHWLIVTFDLHTKYELPHIYIGHRSRRGAYAASYKRLSPLSLGAFGAYPPKFLEHYTIYGIPGHAAIIERLIHPQFADVIDQHFHNASIEIEDNTVYVYIESRYPNETTLEKMVSSGVWFAENIDARLAPLPAS